MIEPKKRPGDMALVPAGGVKRSRTELFAAAQSQQLVAMGPPSSSSLQAPIMLMCGHEGEVYCCKFHPNGATLLWDIRKKGAVHTFQNTYQVLAVTFNDTSDQILSGGIDNDIKVWDLRQNKLVYSMHGHGDSLTGLSLSSEGSYLLSNSMDNTVRIWDVRPFAPKERCVKIFQGNIHNFEKNLLRCSWSADGSKIAAGSADRFVYVWDTTSRRILYKLPGHAGSVNEVAFHPEEPIVLSGASDKRLYMGEIQ
uniref:Small nuclear ribonucleoprotein 40 (U5) n=1 Tax=Oncorhynchus mykiss TaxID=8022 RepID=A0A8C7TV49_ONCMY